MTDILDKSMSDLNLSDHMANLISEYISRFITPYKGLSVAEMVKEANNYGALFTNGDGVLGLKPYGEDTWEVLFFVAETKEARKKLIQEAASVLGKTNITYCRWKHNDRRKTYKVERLMRLA